MPSLQLATLQCLRSVAPRSTFTTVPTHLEPLSSLDVPEQHTDKLTELLQSDSSTVRHIAIAMALHETRQGKIPACFCTDSDVATSALVACIADTSYATQSGTQSVGHLPSLQQAAAQLAERLAAGSDTALLALVRQGAVEACTQLLQQGAGMEVLAAAQALAAICRCASTSFACT
jgi:hypothetical protein